MSPARPRVLLATALLALGPLACDWPSVVGSAPFTMEKPTMSMPPSSSRPPAPIVGPVEHAGVRYIQDATDERQGDEQGGYLAALDAKTGARLWRVKVYKVADHRAAGVSMGGIYFRSMRLLPGGNELEIENEVGGVYRVNLATRNVTKISGPPDEAAPAPVKPKPRPE